MFKIKQTRFILFSVIVMSFLLSFIGRIQWVKSVEQNSPAAAELKVIKETVPSAPDPEKKEEEKQTTAHEEPFASEEDDGITIILD